MKLTKDLYLRIISSLFLIPLTIFIIHVGSVLFILYIFILLFLSVYEWHKMSFGKKYYLIGVIFIFFSFYCVASIRFDESPDAILNFIFVLFVCVGTDIGGYMFGKFFKGPKLTKISPNKTYSGVLGGYLISFLFINIIFVNPFSYFPNTFQINSSLLITYLILSTISQLGDLLISFFKRKLNIKDTGKIIPGHGGILDRIDGMIFAFPSYYLLNQLS
jgi:phosphatidate cytidylyltransferase